MASAQVSELLIQINIVIFPTPLIQCCCSIAIVTAMNYILVNIALGDAGGGADLLDGNVVIFHVCPNKFVYDCMSRQTSAFLTRSSFYWPWFPIVYVLSRQLNITCRKIKIFRNLLMFLVFGRVGATYTQISHKFYFYVKAVMHPSFYHTWLLNLGTLFFI